MNTLSYEKEMIRKTIELIQIPSIKEAKTLEFPFGKPVGKALHWVLELCQSLGMKTKNFDNYIGMAEIGEGEKEIGILCHLDVVSIPEEEPWIYPPFQGVVEDDKIYGRGAIDNKGPTIAAIYAVKKILDQNISLSKRVRLIFFTDEETGWQDVAYYLKQEKPSTFAFVPDGNFPLVYAEKGILQVKITLPLQQDWLKKFKSGEKINMVPREAFLELDENLKDQLNEKDQESFTDTQTFIGKSAHGSLPYQGENAFLKALYFLGSLEKKLDNPLFFEHLYEILKDPYGKGLKLEKEDHSGKLTINPGMAHLDNNQLIFFLDIRYPVSSHPKEIMEQLQKSFLQTEEVKHHLPLHHSTDLPEINILLKAYQTITEDYQSKPIAMGGGTLARAFPNAVAFGAVFPKEEERAHTQDEWISIENLIKTYEIYFLALQELLTLL